MLTNKNLKGLKPLSESWEFFAKIYRGQGLNQRGSTGGRVPSPVGDVISRCV